MRNRPLCFAIVLSAAFSVRANDVTRSTTADGDQLPEAEAVVVSATKTETPINQIGSSVTVITDEEIERNQRRSLPDVLETVPGLNVVQTGGAGGFSSVLIRGANSNHTKIVIDGIDANDPSEDGRFDFGQVLTAELARVEILRGPQSSLYGSDALGGVINIETKKGEGPPHFTGTLEGGSFDTFNQSAGVSGSISRFNYAFNVAHVLVDDMPVTPLDLLPPGRTRIDDSYENRTLSTRLGADFTDTFGVEAVARYTDSTLFFTGDDFSVFPSVPAAKQSEQDVQQLFTRGQAHLDLFDRTFKNTIGLGYTEHRTKIQAPDLGFGLPPPTIDHGDRIKFDWLGNISITENHTLLLGVEDQNDRLLDSPISAEIGNVAGFGELQSQIVHNLFAAASVRWDENELFGGEATWHIAPAYTVPVTETKLKASYGTGFKAPSLTQLFVSFPAFNFFANPNLQPEESEGYDLGFEQPLWQDRVRFGATYFHNDITNLIVPNATFTTLENIGRATTRGAEVFAELSLADRFKFRGDYTYTEAFDDATGLELIRRPKHRASMNVNWRPIDELSLSGTLVYVGSWVDGNRSFSIPRLNADAYYIVNVAAEYDVGKGVTLFTRADNLFDRRYEDPVGFQRPGFGFFAGVRVAWDVKLPASQTAETDPEIYAKEKK